MKKAIEIVKSKIYVDIDVLTNEEKRRISDYLYDLELDEECSVRQFGNYIVVIVSKYSTLTPKDIEIEIKKILESS